MGIEYPSGQNPNLERLTLNWTDFKAIVIDQKIVPHFQTSSSFYYLWAKIGGFTLTCVLARNGDADVTDFESVKDTYFNYVFSYSLPILVRQTATTAANATVWAMLNGSTRTVMINSIRMVGTFDQGTPLARTLQTYTVMGFTGATPAGGSALTPAKHNSALGASAVSVARVLHSGLTMSGASFGDIIFGISIPTVDGAIVHLNRNDCHPLRLAPNEGLAIRLFNTAVVGQAITGEVNWSER